MTPRHPDVPGVPELLVTAFPRSRPASRDRLLDSMEVRDYRPGEVAISQGDMHRIVFVLAGYVGFRRTTIDGRQIMPRIVTAGSLAPIVAISDRPAGAELVTLSASTLGTWSTDSIRQAAMTDAGLAIDILDHAGRAMDELAHAMDRLLRQEATLRVAHILWVHRELLFGDDPVLSRAYLPALVGTSREMTGRVLRSLESHGIVRRAGRDRLELLDSTALRAAARIQETG
jgi:CRP-like cAMP-binding protein